MATIPSPATWVAAQIPTAAQLNADIRDGVAFLAFPPYCALGKTSDPAINASTWTRVDWDLERADSEGMHASGAPSRLVAVTAGRYDVRLSLMWASNPTLLNEYERGAMIRKNSAGSSSGGTQVMVDMREANHATDTPTNSCACVTVVLAASDYLEAFAWQGSSVARNLLGAGQNASTQFSMVWIGTA